MRQRFDAILSGHLRKGFTFSSPECGKANAAVTDVVKITHPVSMASSLFGSFFHLGPMDSTCNSDLC